MKKLSEESGQALIIVAFGFVLIIGFVGMAVDAGLMMQARRQMQTAADSAAIAGALEQRYGDAAVAALNAAAQNGVVNGANGAVVTVNIPPQMGPHTGDGSYVEVIASENRPTFFMRVLRMNSMKVSARAVATLGAGNGCFYGLKSTGTDLLMNGSGDINVPGCGIVENSSDPRDAVLVNGSGSINASSIGVVGQVLTNGTAKLNPTPVTGIAPVADPLGFLSPPSYSRNSCLPNPEINGSGSYELGPASAGGMVCYNGLSINGSARIQLDPGTYIINGEFSVNGSAKVQGSGVTFYLPPGGTFTDNGSSNLQLSAPTKGTYNGVLFYQDPANHSSVTINGSSSSVFSGIFYFPGAQLTLNGSNRTVFNAAFVSGSLLMNGSGTFTNYSLLNGSSPLTSAVLVE